MTWTFNFRNSLFNLYWVFIDPKQLTLNTYQFSFLQDSSRCWQKPPFIFPLSCLQFHIPDQSKSVSSHCEPESVWYCLPFVFLFSFWFDVLLFPVPNGKKRNSIFLENGKCRIFHIPEAAWKIRQCWHDKIAAPPSAVLLYLVHLLLLLEIRKSQ